MKVLLWTWLIGLFALAAYAQISPPPPAAPTVPSTCLLTLGSEQGVFGPTPPMCPNDTGIPFTIVAVACWVDAGETIIQPILTGGSSTSILKTPLTCGVGKWAGGVVQDKPKAVLRSFSGDGSLCAAAPCTLDFKVQKTDGKTNLLTVKVSIRFSPPGTP